MRAVERKPRTTVEAVLRLHGALWDLVYEVAVTVRWKDLEHVADRGRIVKWGEVERMRSDFDAEVRAARETQS